jgi:hypothetical protein
MIELKEFLPPVLSAHSLNALLAEYLCHRTPNSYAFSLHLHTSLDVLQTELLRILNRILVFRTHSRVLSSFCTHARYPLGRAPTELLRGSVHNSVSATLP